MPDLYSREVSDAEFRQRVRRHAPSTLLPAVASAGAQYWSPKLWMDSPYRKFMPWSLAEVARVSLMHGNEYRSAPATRRDVIECCAVYAALRDPDVARRGDFDAVTKFMLRISNEQLGYGHEVMNELARTVALFEQTQASRELRVLTGNWWQGLLSCTPAEYIGVAFLIWAAALVNNGCFTLDWLDNDNMALVRDQVESERVRQIAADQFIAEPDYLRSLQRPLPSGAHPDLRRYSFNPLYRRPAVSGLVDSYVVPVPSLVVRKASPAGLYYTGVEHHDDLGRWGNRFSEDVGWLFEAYIGRQLRLMQEAMVYPSIKYGRRQGEEGVDWIVVFDDAVLLVEVKSRRPTEAVRIGSDQAVKELQVSLPHAVNQLNATADLISQRDPAFAAIPHDRPMIGLVVTMEPFYMANAHPYRQLLPTGRVPYRLCSAYEVEQLVTVTDQTVGRLLLTHMSDPTREEWAIQLALTGHEHGTNAVIDAAWATLPWKMPRSTEHALVKAGKGS
jgi:hypothetical protein